MKPLSSSRFLKRASVCLVVAALLLLPGSAPPAQAQSGPGEFVCNLTEWYCNLQDWLPSFLVDLLDFLADPPEINFQWNPVTPYVGRGDDTVISAVNVPTWFWITSGLEPHNVFRLLYDLYWTPIDSLPNEWCFGDDNIGLSLAKWPAVQVDLDDLSNIHFPPVRWSDLAHLAQWYEYSSYDQSERTERGDPAFEVTVVTWWWLEVIYVCPEPPFVCYFKVPFPVPVCRQKPTPVKQVESVLVPSPWYGWFTGP
jgi:hypothetical protein